MKKENLFKSFALLFIVFLFSGFFLVTNVQAAGVATLTWNANTEADLAGYNIYYGTSPRIGSDPKTCGLCGYITKLDVNKVTTYNFNNLTEGQTYYFSISAYDTSNNESSFSSQVSKVISTPTCTSFTYSAWNTCSASGVQSRTVATQTPSGCTGGSPTLSQTCTPACTSSDWTSSLSPTTCPSSGSQTKTWTKIGSCSGGVSHPSSEAVSCSYFIPTCTSFTYSAWNTCSASGVQSRTVAIQSPTGCTGGGPVLSQSCTYVPPTCTSFTYSAWNSCQSNNTQSRTVTSLSPSGCTGGTPALSQSCTYIPPVLACTFFSYSAWNSCQSSNTQTRTVATQTPSGCTGGTPVLSQVCIYVPSSCASFTYSAWSMCQVDSTQSRTVATASPLNCTGGSPVLSQSCTYVPPVLACTFFTYSAWNSCQSSNTQTRTVATQTPSGCTGGSPTLSQTCDYVAPVVNPITTTSISTVCSLGDFFSTTTGLPCTSYQTLLPIIPVSNSYNFGLITLRNGSQGEPVKELQRFLNQNLNSNLTVDGNLGPKTITIIKTWQTSHGLVPDGLVGAKTKAMMNGLPLPITPIPPKVTPLSIATSSYNFGTATLQYGSTGEAVKELQRFLNAKNGLFFTDLVVNGQFGEETAAAVMRWQMDHGLLVDGIVGKNTKEKMLLVK